MTGLRAELADLGLRAVAPDYPGCGASDHVAFQPSIADYARWTLELTDALGICPGRPCRMAPMHDGSG